MSDCRCLTPPFDYRDYDKSPVGIDATNGRHGVVTIDTCKHCGTKWLNYFVEYEAFASSGRWFRGPLSEEAAKAISAEQAVAYLGQLPWHFAGGSHFRSAGMRSSNPIRADL